MTNRIADLDQLVTVHGGGDSVAVQDQAAQAFIVTAMPDEPALQPRALADWPNFVVVEPGSRIVQVQEVVNRVTTSMAGMQGPPGPAGPAGSLEGNLDGLNDVLLVNLQDGQLLRYSAPLQQWTNSNVLDGGNF